MSSYDLVIGKAKAFNADNVSDVLRDVADFADELQGVVLSVSLQDNSEDATTTAYVLYEG